MQIGLIGYNCHTGLGELNRQIAEYINISAWLVCSHPKVANLPLVDKRYKVIKDIGGLCKQADAILFCERPYSNNLISYAKQQKKKIICIPMQEWLPGNLRDSWTAKVDLFLCPTAHCYSLYKDKLPCKLFEWPVDLNRFKFQQRDMCNKFLFLNGHGGWKGRKGAELVLRLKNEWQDMPLVVSSQSRVDWPRGTEFIESVENNYDLYKSGDVLIAPHSVDGIGLELLEAAACGLPIISTDGNPWNEFPAVCRIPAHKTRKAVGNVVDWYNPDYSNLLEVCRELVGKDIRQYSLEGRKWAESRAWGYQKIKEFYDLIKN